MKNRKHVQTKETPYGQGEFAYKAKRKCPGAYPFMHKKHVQIKETPYGHPFMHKNHVQVKETPYGHPFMHKNHVQVKERIISYGRNPFK